MLVWVSSLGCCSLDLGLGNSLAYADSAMDWDTNTNAGLIQSMQEVGVNMGIIQTSLTPAIHDCSTVLEPAVPPPTPQKTEAIKLKAPIQNLIQTLSEVIMTQAQALRSPLGSPPAPPAIRASQPLLLAVTKSAPKVGHSGDLPQAFQDPSSPNNSQIYMYNKNTQAPSFSEGRVSAPVTIAPPIQIDEPSPPAPDTLSGSASEGLADMDSYYANSPQVRSMLAYAWQSKHPRTVRRCYHYVKQALYRAGIVPRGSLTGNHAYQALPDLKKQGFINLLEITDGKGRHPYAGLTSDPAKAPVGSIVVYQGDGLYPWSQDGDVQIHMADGGWISDYYSPHYMTEQYTYWNGYKYSDKQHFKVIGVMIDPALEAQSPITTAKR